MPLRIFLSTLVIISTTAFGGVDAALREETQVASSDSIKNIVKYQDKSKSLSCPNPGRMSALCGYIREKEKDATPNSDYTYSFQRIVYEASCVDYMNDTDEEISRKVNAMWDRYGANLRCGPMGTPPTGSPLRYSIHIFYNEFITEALSLWKLDLNKIENNMTMLDFIDDRIAHSSGITKKNLESYRDSFIQMGAKRKSELGSDTKNLQDGVNKQQQE